MILYIKYMSSFGYFIHPKPAKIQIHAGDDISNIVNSVNSSILYGFVIDESGYFYKAYLSESEFKKVDQFKSSGLFDPINKEVHELGKTLTNMSCTERIEYLKTLYESLKIINKFKL